ncbi:MAG: hypothetical protein AAF362_14145 [Pseudomonadota bacterium]
MKTIYLAALLSILVLGGCASTIKKYDSTFTSAVSSHGEASGLAIKPVAKLEKPYFIEFRARSALTYGHASVVFGKLDKNGNIPVNKKGVLVPGMVEISGLHPATPSTVPWTVGHVVPVPAETGPSDGDFEDAYVTARYRIDLTEAEFRRVVWIVRKHKNSNPMWYAPIYAANCLGYIGSIAKDMGLKVPVIPDLPKEYVEKLKSLNT